MSTCARRQPESVNMTKIATAADKTVWECDCGCGELAQSTNAFELPPGWWTVEVRRRTAEAGHLKAGSFDVSSKDCFLSAVKFEMTRLVEYVDVDLR